MTSPHKWPLLLAVLSTLLSPTVAGDTILPGDSIRNAGSLVSADGSFKLGFFTPGTSKLQFLGIWYNKIAVQTVVWVANRDHPLPDSTGVLSLAGNGSLVLSDAAGEVYWSTPATGLAIPVARLLNDANFVVVGDAAGDYAWQSFDYPADSLLPGMKLGVDLRTGMNRNITAWKSNSDPGTGEYSMGMFVQGDPQIFLVKGSTRIWRAGPWVGQRFTGIPEMKTYDMFALQFHIDANEVYYHFKTLNDSILSRVLALPSGVVQRVVWIERAGMWNVFWFAPKDPCDAVSPCGPFGVCDTNDYPVCSCLRGFDPRSPQDWYLRDGRDGCVRRTELDCRNGTDGFVRVGGAKLPDTAAATVNMSMDLEECKAACLRNCSCTAYANANATGSGSGCILWPGNLTDLRVYTNGGRTCSSGSPLQI